MCNDEQTLKIEYDKTYYFDKSGISINEEEVKSLCSCNPTIVKGCCRLQLPKGFKFSKDSAGICFNLSNISCIKSPVIQKVTLPHIDCKPPVECEVVSGYEIRAVGDVDFSVSAPLCPISGYCFPIHSHSCCSTTVPVNSIISYTCCPKPCPKLQECVDWTYAYFSITLKEDDCKPYLLVKMGVALEYTGTCDCDYDEE